MKKLLSVFLVSVLLLSSFVVSVSAETQLVDPYTTIQATSYDDSLSSGGPSYKLSRKAECVGSFWNTGWLAFPNVNFGDVSPEYVEIEAAAPPERGGVVVIRIDGEKGPIIAEVPFTRVAFNSPSKARVPLSQEVTGVHTVYVSPKTSTIDFYNFRFLMEEPSNEYDAYEFGGAYKGLEAGALSTEADLLWQLGILRDKKGTEFKGDTYISREWFANAVYGIYKDRAPGIDGANIGSSIETGFADVAGDSAYAEAIAYLASYGVVSGNAQGSFYPHQYITVTDAITILTRILGYQEIAEYEGGYPTGYLKVARRIGIATSVDVTKELQLEEAVYLLGKALKAEYLYATGIIKPDTTTYESLEGILGAHRGLKNATGRVTATSISSISTPETTLDEDEVEIDNIRYNIGNCDVNSLLGYDCEFYYSEDGGKRTLRAIAPDAQVESITLSSSTDQIVEINNNEIVYIDSKLDKEEEIEIDDAKILYNEVVIEGNLTDFVANENSFRGTITVVENSDNSKLVCVDEYEDYVVDGMPLDGVSIKTKDSGEISWNKTDKLDIRTSDEIETTVDRLREGDVITVYDSKNLSKGNRMIRIYTSRQKIEGMVTAVEGQKIYINNEEKRASNSLADGLISAGKQGTFLLNAYSEIVDVENNVSGDWQVGLFMSNTDSALFNKMPQVKIMTKDRKAVAYSLASKVMADGIRVEKGSEMIAGKTQGFNAWVGLYSIEPDTVILYKLNDEGKITHIDTPQTGTGETGDTLKCINPEDSEDVYTYYRASGIVYSTVDKKISMYMPPKDSTVFTIRSTEAKLEDNYTVNTAYDAISSKENEPKGKFYSTTGSDYVADVFVWHNQASGVSMENHFVFESRTQGLDENGEVVTYLNGWVRGSKVSYIFDSTKTYDSGTASLLSILEPGDVIRYGLARDGKTFKRAQSWVLADGESSKTIDGKSKGSQLHKGKQVAGDTPESRGIYGPIVEKGDNYVAVQVGTDAGGKPIIDIFSLSDVRLCSVDKVGDTTYVETTDLLHINKGDVVFAFTRQGTGKLLVVYPDVNM